MSKEKPLQTHDKIIAVPPREGEVPATQPPLPPQQPPQMPPQPQVQQFVPMVLQAQPVPPPPVINGKPVRLMIGIPATPLTDWRWTFQYSQMRVQYPTAMIAADNKYGIAQSREAILNQFNAVPDATHLFIRRYRYHASRLCRLYSISRHGKSRCRNCFRYLLQFTIHRFSSLD